MKIDYWHKFEEGQYYHIYNQTSGNKNILNKKEDYEDFLNKYTKYLTCTFETIAYCLMPNHFHFIVKVNSLESIIEQSRSEISKKAIDLREGIVDENIFILDQFRRFLSSVALAYNHRNSHKGQLFLKRFKRVSLDEEKVKYMICYVHHNPIHHKFTKDYGDWSFSSYNKVITSKSIVESPTSLKYFKGINDFLEIHREFQVNKKEDI